MRDRIDVALWVGAAVHVVAIAALRPFAARVASEPIAPTMEELSLVDESESPIASTAPTTRAPPNTTTAREAPPAHAALARQGMKIDAHAPTRNADAPPAATSSAIGPAISSAISTTAATSASPPVPFLAGSPTSHFGPSSGTLAWIDDAKSKKLDGELGRLLDAEDAKRGGGAGGPVVGATHRAMTLSDAPSTGHAVIEVETDASGQVESVRLVDGTGAPRDWEPVLRALRSALAAERLKVHAGSSGARIRVELDARPRLPSGATDAATYGVGGEAGIGVSVHGDLSDIGATATRQVRVHLTLDQRR